MRKFEQEVLKENTVPTRQSTATACRVFRVAVLRTVLLVFTMAVVSAALVAVFATYLIDSAFGNDLDRRNSLDMVRNCYSVPDLMEIFKRD